MAGLAELKKRLRSVELSGQLAGAMKTVAAAKYAKLNKMLTLYRTYAAAWQAVSFPPSEKSDTAETEGTGDCYVLLGHNRGLCGGYNLELLSYAERILSAHPAAQVILCGKYVISAYEGRERPVSARFILPDTPDFDICRPLIAYVEALLTEGQARDVQILYQSFVNTMNQTPATRLLRLSHAMTAATEAGGDVLYCPDRITVASEIERKVFEAAFYETILEAAAGAQAATLMAMRTAYDNAADSAAQLTNRINKMRQGSVTAGILETAISTEDE